MGKYLSKEALKNLGLVLNERFCELNNIALPDIFFHHIDRNTGYYSKNRIHVDTQGCAKVNVMYSFPGLFCDRTPYGVIQHEFGHYVDDLFGWKLHTEVKRYSKEAPITSYAPCASEWFAEIFRLFVTNPDLLRHMRPRAYDALTNHFEPAIDASWKDALMVFDAPERIIMRAEEKMLI